MLRQGDGIVCAGEMGDWSLRINCMDYFYIVEHV